MDGNTTARFSENGKHHFRFDNVTSSKHAKIGRKKFETKHCALPLEGRRTGKQGTANDRNEETTQITVKKDYRCEFNAGMTAQMKQ